MSDIQSALQPLAQRLLSLGISLGGFVYPLCLFYAAVWMVDKGKTTAKADVHYFAVSSVTLYIIGIALVLARLIVRHFHLSCRAFFPSSLQTSARSRLRLPM